MATKSSFPSKKSTATGIFKQRSDGPAKQHTETLSYAKTVKPLQKPTNAATKTLKR